MTDSKKIMVPVSKHGKKKIKIADDSGRQPMMLIVKFCLEMECSLYFGTPKDPFHTDRGGTTTCHMWGKITIDDILDHFELSHHYEVGDQYIANDYNRTYFYLRTEQDYKNYLDKQEARKKKREQRVLKIQKKRAELEMLKPNNS